MGVSHVFTSPKADGADATLVRPSDWNSAHSYQLQDAVSLSGNTSGVLANISSGTLYLAGGNNVTLSQNANSVTISAANETQTVPPIATNVTEVMSAGSTGTVTRFAPEDHAHRGVNLVQISGNTSNTSNIVYGSVYLAGGNNITLSQVSGAGKATITISAANETQTVPPIATQVTEVMSAGSTGTITRFAPEDHAHRGVNLVQISGNTSNTSNVVYGSVYLAGGNNITLSQVSAAGKATITISAANETQTVPPIATTVTEVMSAGSVGTITRFAPEDHAHRGVNLVQISGNTSNTSNVVYGSVYLAGGNNITLSQATAAGAATITISGPAVGSASTFAAGISTAGNTSGTSGLVSLQMVFVGTNNITLSQSVNGNSATLTISGAAAGAPAVTLSQFPQAPAYWPSDGIVSAGNSGTTGGTGGSTQYSVQMTCQPMQLPYYLSYSRLNMIVVGTSSAAGTGSGSIGWAMGLYTLSGATFSQLSTYCFMARYSQNSSTNWTIRYYWGTNSTSNSTGVSANSKSNFAGARMLIPLYGVGTSLTAGEYYMVCLLTKRVSSTDVWGIQSYQAINTTDATVSLFGIASGTRPGNWQGVFSTTTNTNVTDFDFVPLPGSFNTSDLSYTGGTSQQMRNFFMFHNT